MYEYIYNLFDWYYSFDGLAFIISLFIRNIWSIISESICILLEAINQNHSSFQLKEELFQIPAMLTLHFRSLFIPLEEITKSLSFDNISKNFAKF